jgi:hypothetical protein
VENVFLMPRYPGSITSYKKIFDSLNISELYYPWSYPLVSVEHDNN